ncbi:unnamed protein product [Cylindrotheca closterium]|uniref:Uncharacterized protein n=1 Tax=Cylindrotheca closterium TaxID=2856 RepID=A0AAD2G1U1_9STRA|nr:unnamed protein product [Cylindrotheca closterium]
MMVSRIQLLLLLVMAVVAVIVSAEEEHSSQIHEARTTTTKDRTKRRIRGRRLALPLDTELDDDWDYAIRAPKDDPHIHSSGKAGKAGKSGKNDSIQIETQSPSKTQNEEDDDGFDNGDSSSKPPNKGNSDGDSTKLPKGDDDDVSLDDDLASLHSMPSESPSARPSQAPAGLGPPSPQLVGMIPGGPSPNQSTIYPKDPQAPIPTDTESSVSNNATDGPTSTTNAGMMIGVAVSGVGLAAVAMFLFKRQKKRKRLVLTASQLEDDDMEHERGGKRRKIVKDGVVNDDDDDYERGQMEALVSNPTSSSRTSRQAPATPGPLSPTKVRDGVIEDDDEEGWSFTGVYKLQEHYNLTGFLEATGVPWAIRSAAARARPIHYITHEGNVITMKFKGVPRATYILDGPAVENVLRDRRFACKAIPIYTVDGYGFEVHQQGVDGGDYDIQLRWTLSEDDMTVQLTMTAIFKPDPKKNKTREPVRCTQIYSRIGEF